MNSGIMYTVSGTLMPLLYQNYNNNYINVIIVIKNTYYIYVNILHDTKKENYIRNYILDMIHEISKYIISQTVILVITLDTRQFFFFKKKLISFVQIRYIQYYDLYILRTIICPSKYEIFLSIYTHDTILLN